MDGRSKALNEAIAKARHNAEAACSLFALATYEQRSIEDLESVRASMVRAGISGEFLSNYSLNKPFI